MAVKFNPVGGDKGKGAFDLTSVSKVASADSNTTFDGFEVDTSGVVWFTASGHRYKLAGTLSDPVGGLPGTPMGLLLALTYP